MEPERRWNLWLEHTAQTPEAQRVEVLIIRNKKTFANANSAIGDGSLTDMTKTYLYDASSRSDFKVIKTNSFVMMSGYAKAISRYFKTHQRKSDDWRDATDAATYAPVNSQFVVIRHSDIDNPMNHRNIKGTFNVTSFSYSISVS
mmetsp:Transcript_3780/g.9497  ORF Transcript_3780/g.9497 Transcript_3780/m.9497 type:complete len:145 (+) Transcript_3780:273-707(+)